MRRYGVPSRSRSRLLDELALHARDALEANGYASDPASAQVAAVRALGDPEHIAAEAARRRGWASRLPLLTFIIAPIFALPIAIVVHLLIASLLLSRYNGFEPDPSTFLSQAIYWCAEYAGFYGLPLAVTWAMARLARRDELAAGWPLLSAAIAYLIHACVFIKVMPPAVSGGSGSLMLKVMVPLNPIAAAPTSSIWLSAILFLPVIAPALFRLLGPSYPLPFSKT